ncbi:glutaminyl-peptide cyclotransferase [Perlabentimonas gracilis]|uniref:glutaminyl-peptide cyclotransferase n=1 Tax=Perlabentimonas gracilis TaxID=2715279 RepID=UPI001409CEFC|nr:glutaminyl-peptide cyclotransferase [Perlabentimonas gracilis]NHB69460.1 glutaminyl-peptide cyclotransferase [Perlabentimonas gracilis]
MNRISLLGITFCALALGACNGSKTTERTERERSTPLQLVRVSEPVNGVVFTLGESFNLNLRLINDTIAADSIVLSIDNNRIGQLQGLSRPIDTDNLSLGSHLIRATAWYNGQRQTASVGFKIKSNQPPKQLSYRIVNTYPHDIGAYTQGLFYFNGHLIESTGQKGQSTLRRVEIETGKVKQSVNLERQYFGEGATIINDEIYQITWTSRKGFVYEPNTFNLIRTFDYPTQGWGLTTVGEQLVMSDGSNILYFLEPKSFTEIKRVEVYDHRGAVNQLNELEYINGKIYANIYLTDKIVIINPTTGMVEAEVDFSNLLTPTDRHRNIDVFNGIAWDQKNDRLFVTGKNWPKLFEVKIQ